MSRGVQAFKQTDVAKALKAARSAGLIVERFEIERGGKIVIVAGKPAAVAALNDDIEQHNPWDDVK